MTEGDDGMSSKGAQLSVECSTSTTSGGVAEALDLVGVDTEGSGVERCVVSMLL